jgi:hypothetical protein
MKLLFTATLFDKAEADKNAMQDFMEREDLLPKTDAARKKQLLIC